MDLVQLRNMILARPTTKDLANAGADNQVADNLNAELTPVVRRVRSSLASRWLAMGRRKKLTDAFISDNPLVASMAQQAIATIDKTVEYIDVDAEFMGMFAYLVANGILTVDDKTSFLQIATEYFPVTEYLLGATISAGDVSAALSGDRPDGVLAMLPNS